MLIVSPSALSRITETKMDRGMETAMINVGRQSPRKEQNHDGGQAGGDQPFPYHSLNRRAHEKRLIEQRLDAEFARQRLCRPRHDRLDAIHHGQR